jgi:phosphatidylserine/phosphatidylglycerophosphate/cardiolipin synthase-like enzyme
VLRRNSDVTTSLATLHGAGRTEGMLVKSSPSDRATASRVVFQMLIEGAVSNIDIHTPYFLPDKALRRALIRAARRGSEYASSSPASTPTSGWYGSQAGACTASCF